MRRGLPAILLVAGLLLPPTAQAECHYRRLEKVIDHGQSVELNDGSKWEVSGFDQGTASSWQQDATITACDTELINTEDHETVQARQTTRGDFVPETD